MPSSLYSSLVNEAMNWVLQSEITHFGRPWSFQAWWKKSLAAPSAVTVVCVRIKCTLLEMESTTVMITSCPEDSGSSTTKLTLSVSHRASRTESGWSLPTRECRQGFVWRQRSQVLTYWPIYVRATRAEHSRRFLSLNYAIEWVTTHLQEIPQRIKWGSWRE